MLRGMKRQNKMRFLDDHERCSTPKLPLFSFPINRGIETPGLATPPVNIAGTVPFLWEEAPGKPRSRGDTSRKGSKQNGVGRSLELPPRLLLRGTKGQTKNEQSPTTVLDGPYVVRRRSQSLPRSTLLMKGGSSVKEKGLDGSKTWGYSGKNEAASEGKFDFSRYPVSYCGGCGGTEAKKISRAERKRSFLNLAFSKSHFWARIYEGFKQVIPWRRKQENMRRMRSSTI